MGLLGKMAVKVAKDAALKATAIGVTNHLEKTRSVNALKNETIQNYSLIAKKKRVTIKRGFTVFDEFENKKYDIQTEALTFGYPSICLYDAEGDQLGSVELTSKTGTSVYTVYLEGKKFGTLTQKLSLGAKFDISFNGWRLDGSVIKGKYAVIDQNENMVLKISSAYADRETYVIEIANRAYEVLGLLLFMAVEIAYNGTD